MATIELQNFHQTKMPKLPSDALVKMALTQEPKTIRDDLYLIAHCWVNDEYGNVTGPKALSDLSRIYTYLLKHSHPETLIREKRKYLEAHPDLAEKYESTEKLRCETLERQPPLPIELEKIVPSAKADWEQQRFKLSELRNSIENKTPQVN